MKTICDEVEEILAAGGEGGLDDGQRAHYQECSGCRSTATALNEVCEVLANVGDYAPPAEVAARTVEMVREVEAGARREVRRVSLPFRRRSFQAVAAAACGAVVLFVVLLQGARTLHVGDLAFRDDPVGQRVAGVQAPASEPPGRGFHGSVQAGLDSDVEFAAKEAFSGPVNRLEAAEEQLDGPQPVPASPRTESNAVSERERAMEIDEILNEESESLDKQAGYVAPLESRDELRKVNHARLNVVDSVERAKTELDSLGNVRDAGEVDKALAHPPTVNQPMALGEATAFGDDVAATRTKARKLEDGFYRQSAGNKKGGLRSDLSAPQRAGREEIFADLKSLENLSFQEAKGYWSNTYVPGDPLTRKLEGELDQLRRDSAVGPLVNRLCGSSFGAPSAQPFDRPDNAAMGVYLHADEMAVAGETRLFVQVGLKATDRSGRLRPPMNVALVLDLRGPAGEEERKAIRSLLFALHQAMEVGDRFTVVTTGGGGEGRPGEAIAAENFTYGSLTVTADKILQPSGNTIPLVQALEIAVDAVRRGEDEHKTLGTSAIFLVTDGVYGSEGESVRSFASSAAIGGVPVSVFGVGTGVDAAELGRIAAAGQGNRRFVGGVADAGPAIERELSAVNRVVARALRLRIRLAPGVKLVRVLGSARLDDSSTREAKRAEESIDRRIAKDFGIEADRGEDDDGMQILIPAFYAGDAHVILLDTAVSSPGAVADVQLRYKDLVFLRNGEAHANLSLGVIPTARGPLEENVLRNLLAFEESRLFQEASSAFARGDAIGGEAGLRTAGETIHAFRGRAPSLAHEDNILSDLRFIEAARQQVWARTNLTPTDRAALAKISLLASRYKIVPKNSGEQTGHGEK